MATVLGGYEDNASAKNSALREVTATSVGDKAYLDVNSSSAILRSTSTITVTGGTGTISLTGVNIRSNFIGVQGPNATNETFTVSISDDDSGVEIANFQARSSDGGVARSKTIGLAIFDVTITITSASVDGNYTYLIMG